MGSKSIQIFFNILLLTVVVCSIYYISFPFIQEDFGEEYTINQAKNICSENLDLVDVNCDKYLKLYIILHIGIVLVFGMILILFYFDKNKENARDIFS